jgi:1-acyl-sn-glycerol-3-phosphate acyltransferase
LRIALALWRILGAVSQLLAGALTCALLFPFIGPTQRMQQVKRWSVRMLRVLGIQLRSSGVPQTGPLLVVSNHVSWLDILAINAVHPARFVSKSDVRAWPLIGWLVACAGTLFIERERKRDALRVVHQVAATLKAGEVVAVFPEGTTSDGRGLLPFHANLLQAAISTETPVQPVVLRFADSSAAFSPAAAYVGDTSLVQSLWWIVMARGLQAHVAWLPAEASAGVERRILSERLRGRIVQVLNVTELPLKGGQT